ncbi:MAG: hypothetical protein K9K30_03855 [Burkholderiaceae bacterium]|nr:hypothetical protein [Sulfuritalea sp.]MCF8174355.1 hypothetical protein [Burkholderiaceae bacterium]
MFIQALAADEFALWISKRFCRQLAWQGFDVLSIADIWGGEFGNWPIITAAPDQGLTASRVSNLSLESSAPVS